MMKKQQSKQAKLDQSTCPDNDLRQKYRVVLCLDITIFFIFPCLSLDLDSVIVMV